MSALAGGCVTDAPATSQNPIAKKVLRKVHNEVLFALSPTVAHRSVLASIEKLRIEPKSLNDVKILDEKQYQT